MTMRLDLLPDDSYAFFISSQLHVELETLLVQVAVALPSSSGKFDAFATNSVGDVCKYFKTNNGNMFLRLFFNGHFGKRRFPSSCPIKPGFYSIENYQLNESFLRVRAVDTKFLVKINLCSGSECFVRMKFYGEVRDRKKWEKETTQKSHNKAV